MLTTNTKITAIEKCRTRQAKIINILRSSVRLSVIYAHIYSRSNEQGVFLPGKNMSKLLLQILFSGD